MPIFLVSHPPPPVFLRHSETPMPLSPVPLFSPPPPPPQLKLISILGFLKGVMSSRRGFRVPPLTGCDLVISFCTSLSTRFLFFLPARQAHRRILYLPHRIPESRSPGIEALLFPFSSPDTSDPSLVFSTGYPSHPVFSFGGSLVFLLFGERLSPL